MDRTVDERQTSDKVKESTADEQMSKLAGAQWRWGSKGMADGQRLAGL